MNDMQLYPSEAQIARQLLGAGKTEEWKGIATVLEREGLPKINPQFGGRYWPAVKAWLDVYERVDKIAPPKRQGIETWTPSTPRPASSGGIEKRDNVRPIGSRARNS